MVHQDLVKTTDMVGIFPAVTAGWRINEDFLQNVKAVSNLKLRAGYGGSRKSIYW
jgi:hypothetical protein